MRPATLFIVYGACLAFALYVWFVFIRWAWSA